MVIVLFVKAQWNQRHLATHQPRRCPSFKSKNFCCFLLDSPQLQLLRVASRGSSNMKSLSRCAPLGSYESLYQYFVSLALTEEAKLASCTKRASTARERALRWVPRRPHRELIFDVVCLFWILSSSTTCISCRSANYARVSKCSNASSPLERHEDCHIAY